MKGWAPLKVQQRVVAQEVLVHHAEGRWGAGSTAAVKAYRGPPGDRQGGYQVRLNGLYQLKLPASSGRLKADLVVDLHTTVRPSAKGYPFTAGRGALRLLRA